VLQAGWQPSGLKRSAVSHERGSHENKNANDSSMQKFVNDFATLQPRQMIRNAKFVAVRVHMKIEIFIPHTQTPITATTTTTTTATTTTTRTHTKLFTEKKVSP
jgi:hypothetical protein